MKGVKITFSNFIVILLALVVMTQFLGFFIAGSIILILLAYNAYLRNKETKAEAERSNT